MGNCNAKSLEDDTKTLVMSAEVLATIRGVEAEKYTITHDGKEVLSISP